MANSFGKQFSLPITIHRIGSTGKTMRSIFELEDSLLLGGHAPLNSSSFDSKKARLSPTAFVFATRENCMYL